MGKIILVSGPSGMAKTTIQMKIERFSPILGINFSRVIVSTSRDMRPGESQGSPWYFEPKEKILERAKNNPDNYFFANVVGGDVQGLDVEREIRAKIQRGYVTWCELDVQWISKIENWIRNNMMEEIQSEDLKIVKVFLSPLSEREIRARMIEHSCSEEEIIQTEIRQRLTSRRSSGLDNLSDEKLLARAKEASKILLEKDNFDCVIVNHQGEESFDWGSDQEFPTGEAARVLNQFIQICK